MSKLWRNTGRTCALLVSLATVFRMPARAQEQPQGIIRVGVNLVLLDATVKNKSGQIMADLKKEDFEVREDGVVQKLDVFSRDELPLEVALVLDLSDSIGPFLGPLRDAATTALAALKPDDEVALFTFSTEAQLRVPFTKDKSKIAEEMLDASLSPDRIRTKDQFDVGSIGRDLLTVRIQFCDQVGACVYPGVGDDPDFPIQG